MTTTQYTIWANNTGGSVSEILNITVNDQVPGLNISPENTTATNNTAITPIIITSTGPGEIVTWELEGTLPLDSHGHLRIRPFGVPYRVDVYCAVYDLGEQ